MIEGSPPSGLFLAFIYDEYDYCLLFALWEHPVAPVIIIIILGAAYLRNEKTGPAPESLHS